jgi:hypothetical protein
LKGASEQQSERGQDESLVASPQEEKRQTVERSLEEKGRLASSEQPLEEMEEISEHLLDE